MLINSRRSKICLPSGDSSIEHGIITMLLDEVQASHTPYGLLLKIPPRWNVIQKSSSIYTDAI